MAFQFQEMHYAPVKADLEIRRGKREKQKPGKGLSAAVIQMPGYSVVKFANQSIAVFLSNHFDNWGAGEVGWGGGGGEGETRSVIKCPFPSWPNV